MADNREDASVERKMYINFYDWLKQHYVDGFPSTEEWRGIMSSALSPSPSAIDNIDDSLGIMAPNSVHYDSDSTRGWQSPLII